MRLRWILLGLVFLAAVFIPRAGQAQSKSLVWERYDVTLTVEPDGDLRVVERQTIRFTSGSFSFGFAVIPLDKTGQIVDVAIREPGGEAYQQVNYSSTPYTFYTQRNGNELEIYWNFPPVSNDLRTYELSYTATDAVRIYDSGDKLQWIAIDNERDFPINAANVVVHIPSGAEFQIVDSAGVLANWEKSADGSTVTYVAQESLPSYETFEIGVEFSHGFLPDQTPTWQEEHDSQERYNQTIRPILTVILGLLAAILIIGGPIAVYLLWYVRGRDPRTGPVPETINAPPDDLAPGLLGTLIDEQADMRDVIATLIDLARRGHLEIEELKTKKGIFSAGSADFLFRKSENASDDLNPVEQEVLGGVFKASSDKGAERKLSQLRNKFYRKLPAIQKQMYESLVEGGYFKSRPDSSRARWKALAVVALILSCFGGAILAPVLAQLSGAAPFVFGGFGVTSVALLAVARHMPSKTRKGAEAAVRWKAFKNYLTRIEQLQDLESTSEVFERYLPYAIALGMKDSWVWKFSRIETTPAPGWYIPYGGWVHTGHSSTGTGGKGLARPGGAPTPASGPGGLQGMSEGLSGGLQQMSSGLSQLLNNAGRVMSSAPSSSSSGWSGTSGGGGFSSGGFSGGGGGGGGGRGFG